ncbi:type I polyketide synthase [Litorisediminicola beolgyonensis]|uniref:SDR family NAD(P)-dependent oxidoreductase n=1 Tax=Litorisediminicola beolgyonensis TaxID=1173614 RepID=A0ABW3ZGU6_9RHOB
MTNSDAFSDTDIAITGMAAHLPGAADIAAYWRNLRDGVSSIRRLSDDELRASGESPGLMRHRNYVPFAAPLDGFEMFDAEFFGFSPKEAAILDPQHRRFLETAWEALENAGHVPEGFDGTIGVFAGCGMGSYFYFNICSNPDLIENTGMFLLRHTGNDKDFLTTRLSHVLDLKGPSINLQTACSTSLVATHYAVQALLNGECDMAIAGGVTIELPQMRGYLYKENEILSPDGACHAFDHRAAGTVFGSGAGVVVLRRLADAQADGDHVWAVIKGTAVNNDGAAKAGYLAPSVDGQAAAIAEAQAVAGVSADSIGYVECHGTGTYLGDPIEVAALSQAFRETTENEGFCRIGSVKTNIGHLDTAAGAASLIKTALALHNGQIPPSLGFEAPNPAIAFEGSPFLVNDRLSDWLRTGAPRRAGVNSLGVGGTNAHVVLEEAPERAASEEAAFPFQILSVSGRSKAALDDNAKRLAAHLRAHPEQPLADIAFTLKQGRRAFAKRRIVVAESHEDAARLLETGDARRVHSHTALDAPDVAFLFPGGGAQYAGMARDLYETEPVFADWADRGLARLEELTGTDPRTLWFPDAANRAEADRQLLKPSLQLPLILITEIALAKLWESWGVTPAALAGHSMGENAAACIAGVMSFEDCIGLVHLRGQLFDTVPAGGMLSVGLSATALAPYLGDDLDLASENAPDLSVASGPNAALDRLEARLVAEGIECRRVGIDIAAHSRMLEPILTRFRDYLAGLDLKAPQIPLVSNRSGKWMTDDEATSPDYWVGHLRNTVRYADCVETLADSENRIFLEVGPGKALSAFTRQHPRVDGQTVLSSLRHPDEEIADDRYFLEGLGRLWALGAEIDWDQIWGGARRNRVVLPTYAFQRAPYFIEPGAGQTEAPSDFLERIEDVADWGWTRQWRARPADLEAELDEAEPQTWLMFMDDAGVADRASDRLRSAGHRVVEVRTGDLFARRDTDAYVLAPERGREGYDLLLQDLLARGTVPTRIAHFWLVTADESHRPGSSFFHRLQEHGFYSLLFLAQSMAEETLPGPIHLTVVTNGAEKVKDEALPYPAKATASGPARMIPRELPGVSVSTLDLALPALPDVPFWARGTAQATLEEALARLTEQVVEELLSEPGNRSAALRGSRRYEARMSKLRLPGADFPDAKTVLLTGGFGGIGLTLAKRFAATGANLVLVGRSALPDRALWSDYLRRHASQDPISRRIRAVEELESLGATVMVADADVCNLTDMQRVADAATERFGRIDGVIHGAGVIADAPLLAKTPSSVEDVFTPKIHGTEVLGQVFPDGSVDWMVLFSSSSTVTAPAGQVDYVAANEYLNAFAEARAGGTTRVTAINWGIWSEVGMAAEAVARRTGEVPQASPEPVAPPLLDEGWFDRDGRRVFSTRLTQDAWVIDEHRTADGTALLPGTGYLSLAAQALAAQGEGQSFELRDLTFLRPMIVPADGARDMRVRLTRSDAGYRFDILGDASSGQARGHLLSAQGQIALRPIPPAPRLDLGAIRARLGPPQAAADGRKLSVAQEKHLRFGPRWRVLDTRATGASEGLADLSLPLAAREDTGWGLHPALLDIATGWAMELIEGYAPDHLWVPVSYGSVKVHGPLPERIVSWVRTVGDNRAEGESASFDVTLAAPDGTVIVEIAEFSIRRLSDPQRLGQGPKPLASEIETDTPDSPAPLSPAEERLQHNLEQGIRPEDGADAFGRALALGRSRLVVSSLPLDALTEQAGRSETTASGQSFDRPELEGDFVAPETDIERTLAGFWEELLGVRNVGVEDSFFDLGGHSLIAVRLFSMVKKTWRVEFPISILFEAPTIRRCAALIEERVGVSASISAATPGAPKAPERRFRHLVAMHDGEVGPKTPFFLVAGMFGNVLNLRHLAHLLGADRRFYGLQAKGLYGDEEPHRSIEAAARDYIAEIKQVQPEGPYLLGGFSGGGITAYEIARQLEKLGDEVGMVALLDTPLPQRRSLSGKDRALIQMQELRRKGLGYPLVWARNRLAWELEKRRGTSVTATETSFHNAEIEAAFLDAVARYEVRPWDGKLVLFRPPQQAHWTVSGGRGVDWQRAYLFHDNDWGQFVPGVEVHEVPGDHDSMVLEPNVRVLAAALRRAISDATRRYPDGTVVDFVTAAE